MIFVSAQNIAKNALRENQTGSTWLSLLSKFELDNEEGLPKSIDRFVGYIYEDDEVELLEGLICDPRSQCEKLKFRYFIETATG